MSKPIIVRNYKSEGALQRDAQRMRRGGYRIVSTSKRAKVGCLRWLIIGPFALLWKKHELTVTYELDRSLS